MGGEFRFQPFLVDEGSPGDVGGPELIPEQPEEFLDHEEGIALRMQRPLLGVFPRQANVFVEIEAGNFGGGEDPVVGRFGQMFIEARGGVSRCQPEDITILAGQIFPDVAGDDAGADLAHMNEITSDNYFE